jgi:hypothetical protein
MRRLLVSFVVLLCLTSVAFAAPKKIKKAAPPDSEPKISFDLDSCVDKAIDYRTLMVTNPYDNSGKCYWLGFPMVKQQMLSRSVALIGFAGSQQNIFALMDFGKESVPMGMISGLVMGMGAYEYETVSGSVNTVHHLRKLDGYLHRTKSQQKEKAARDKKVVDEQAKQIEIKEAEDQKASALAREEAKEIEIRNEEKRKEIEAMRAKELREEPLIYTDYETGLIWAKNGNISGEKMTWQKAQTWAGTLNYAGYLNWRLPTLKEFLTFTKQGRKWLEANSLSNIGDCYWSSTESGVHSVPSVNIWDNNSGEGEWRYKDYEYNKCVAWPVHSAVTELEGKSATEQIRLQKKRDYESQIENEKLLDKKIQEAGLEIKDGVIIDKNSGLMWLRDANIVGKMTLNAAIEWAGDFKYAGYSDWKIPTTRELKTLSKYGPEILTHAVKNMQISCYLSTSKTGWLDNVFNRECIYMINDVIGSHNLNNNESHNVLPVRGGEAAGWFSNILQ